MPIPPGRQYALTLPPATAGDDPFIVTDANREAHAWITAWPCWNASALILCGPEGSGKSHLARLWLERTGAQTLTARVLEQLPPPGVHALLEQADEVIQEEMFFHLFNRMALSGGSLLLTARTSPKTWNIILPDLRSRLLALPVATLLPPDDELLKTLIWKHFSDRQLRISPEAAAYLHARAERSYAGLRELVARIDGYALAVKREISIPLLREVLGGDPADPC